MMIGRVTGILLEKHPPQLLLDVNGIGYELEIPLNHFNHLPAIGEKVTFYTHFVVREDAQLLYGFINSHGRKLFRSLIKVNGVGPKVAMGILSSISPESFVRCVIENDTANLILLPGIGRKTAERLIIEMRDRLTEWAVSEIPISSLTPELSSEEIVSTHRGDAIQALISLGYKPHEAQRAVSKIEKENLTCEELIRLVLTKA